MKVCKEKGFTINKIGSIGKNKEYSMFKIVINNHLNKRVVCFSAGIHGEEPAGPFAVLSFLKKFNLKKFRKIKIIIFPVANPYGFDKGIRRNFLNKDLNGHFCHKKLTGENKILYNSIKREKIFFFHALHEDEGLKRFYLYNFENKEEKIYRDAIKLAKKYFPIKLNRSIYGDPARNGLIVNRKDGSFEDRLFRNGAVYSMCTETPEARPFNQRVRCNVDIMNLVLKFSLR